MHTSAPNEDAPPAQPPPPPPPSPPAAAARQQQPDTQDASSSTTPTPTAPAPPFGAKDAPLPPIPTTPSGTLTPRAPNSSIPQIPPIPESAALPRKRPHLSLPKHDSAFVSPFPTTSTYNSDADSITDRPRTGRSGTPIGHPSTPNGSSLAGATSYFSLPRSVSRKKSGSTSTSAGSWSAHGLLSHQKSFDSSSAAAGITGSGAGSTSGVSTPGGITAKMFPGTMKSGEKGTANPFSMYENVHDVATKRIATLDYLRRAHEGRIYWFNTMLFTKADLNRTIYHDTRKLSRRAANYFVLGLSIPNILDIGVGNSAALDYLRAFNQLLTEYESYQSTHPTSDLGYAHTQSSSSRRLPKLFSRSSTNKPRRGSTAALTAASWSSSEITLVNSDQLERVRSSSGGAASISGPIHEFDGDSLISPPTVVSAAAATPSLAGTGLGTPGLDNDYTFLSTPSLPFEPDFYETFATLCDVLIEAYTRVLSLVATPENCGPGVAEMFMKADTRVRKCVISDVVREFGDATRGNQGIKGEIGAVGKLVFGGLLG